MKSYKVSVIVPIYNVDQYLEVCINSIREQTYKNIELILVDDGSPDTSGDFCDLYAAKDDRILVIHKVNEGVVKARKVGLEAATGDYVMFVDGDDWIESGMIDSMFHAALGSEPDIIVENFYFDTGGKLRESYDQLTPGIYDASMMVSEIYPYMIYSGRFYEWGLYPTLCTKLFKIDVVKPYLMKVPNDITIGDDLSVTYGSLYLANSLVLTDKRHYHYRYNPRSVTQRYSEKTMPKVGILLDYVMHSLDLPKGIQDQLDYYGLYIVLDTVIKERLNESSDAKEKLPGRIDDFMMLPTIKALYHRFDFKKLPLIDRVIHLALKNKRYKQLWIWILLWRIKKKIQGKLLTKKK